MLFIDSICYQSTYHCHFPEPSSSCCADGHFADVADSGGGSSVPLADGLQLLAEWISNTLGFGAACLLGEGMQPAVPQAGGLPWEAPLPHQWWLFSTTAVMWSGTHAWHVAVQTARGTAGWVDVGTVPAVLLMLVGTCVSVSGAQSWFCWPAGCQDSLGAAWD